MRISTNTIFEQGLGNVLRAQGQMIRSQEQLATGKRVTSPADDPVAASRALELSQSKSMTDQYARNGELARGSMVAQENALARYTELLQDAKVVAVNSVNAALSSAELRSLATTLQGYYQEMLSVANTTDANGTYLFSGYQGSTRPFSETAPGVVEYRGDDGTRLAPIGPGRNVPASQSGADIFQRIPQGNGYFSATVGTGNTGTGVIGRGAVLDGMAWASPGNSRNFELRFHVDSGVTPASTTYDIVDTVNGVSLLTGQAPAAGPHPRAFQPGATIRLETVAPPDSNPQPFNYGAELSISGQPANGDVFTLAPSTPRDVFSVMQDLISALQGAASGPAGRARLQNAINASQNGLDNALDVNLTRVASLGTYMREVDSAVEAAGDTSLQLSTSLSELQDLDYAAAISKLSFQQVSLDAAQKSFLRIQELSLFSML